MNAPRSRKSGQGCSIWHGMSGFICALAEDEQWDSEGELRIVHELKCGLSSGAVYPEKIQFGSISPVSIFVLGQGACLPPACSEGNGWAG